MRVGIYEFCALLLLGGLAMAQQPGEVRLTVVDSSGAPVAATGSLGSHLFRTGRDGTVVLSALAPGSYSLSLRKQNFADFHAQLDVRSGVPLERTVTLSLQHTGFSIAVVAGTPLAGSELNRDQFPAPVQTAMASDIADTNAVALGSFLNRRFSGIHINEVQGNPYQPDVSYRGYTASPLLGTPQGLSLYLDGVRLNQPFGDVVSWDLIPRTAIAETTLVSGSNPLFGLNTLGGAIAVETKSGLTAPGATLSLAGGNWGRKTAELEYGGWNRAGFSWYGAVNFFFEDGWREASSSDVRQFFGKAGWQRNATSLSVSLGYANNALVGNGLQEQRFLSRDYRSIYTKPDITANRSPLMNLTFRQGLTTQWTLSGNTYYRFIRTATLNADLNENALDQAVYQPSAADQRALADAGYSGFPQAGANAQNAPFPKWRCIAQALQHDEPAEKCNALLNRTNISQQSYGLTGQATYLREKTQITIGTAFDRRTSTFGELSQLGYLNPDRSVTGVNAFGDGITGGNINGDPFDTRVNLDGRALTGSVFALASHTFPHKLNVMVSGRFNRNTIRNRDGFNPGGGSGSLDGNYTFSRFNPAVGLTYHLASFATFYASYAEGSRAPTSTELGCADPNTPCKLPNALAGDPPLRQVVTRTVDVGFRGGAETGWNWSAGWFTAENRDDLLFASSTQTGYGYFKNFGRTQRRGLEANVHGRTRSVDLGGSYTFLNATYRTAEILNASSNSSNTGGNITLQPGNRIPLIPRNTLKAFALWKATTRLNVNLDFLATGRSFARGNENNLAAADGLYFLGPPLSPGYALFNLGGHYLLRKQIELFAELDNVTSRKYYSAAQLSVTGFSAEGTYLARPFPSINGDYPLQHATFYAPGAPRTVWGGVRFHF